MTEHKLKGVDFTQLENYLDAESWKAPDLERDYGLPIDRIPNVDKGR